MNKLLYLQNKYLKCLGSFIVLYNSIRTRKNHIPNVQLWNSPPYWYHSYTGITPCVNTLLYSLFNTDRFYCECIFSTNTQALKVNSYILLIGWQVNFWYLIGWQVNFWYLIEWQVNFWYLIGWKVNFWYLIGWPVNFWSLIEWPVKLWYLIEWPVNI